MSIRLSEKHGVNPAIPKCYYCNKDKNEIILTGRLPKDAQAPQGMIWDEIPCDTCQSIMKAGVICISIDAAKSDDPDNPWRTGGWCAIKDAAIQRMGITPELEAHILKARVAFITDETWDALGLPRGAVDGVPEEWVKTL